MPDFKVGDHVHFEGTNHFTCAVVTEVNDDGTYTAQAHHDGNEDCPTYRWWAARQQALAYEYVMGDPLRSLEKLCMVTITHTDTSDPDSIGFTAFARDEDLEHID